MPQLNKILSKFAKGVVDLISDSRKIADEEIATLKEDNIKLRKQLVTKSCDLEKLQQYQNRDVIKICGVKEPAGLGPHNQEDTNKTVKDLFKKIDTTITDQDISVTHRLRSREQRPGQPKAILFKANRRDFRNKCIRLKKKMRENTEFKSAYPNVFMVEHLTPLRSKVAYKLRHDSNIEKCWTIDGKIKVVKNGAASSDYPITIDSLEDLSKLGWSPQEIEDLLLKE